MRTRAKVLRGPAFVRPDGPFVARPWGGFQTLEEGAGYKVKRLVVQPGCRLSLQRHRYRAEHWVVIAGAPRVIIGTRARRLRARGTVSVPRGAWHRIENPGETLVVIIEVQHGPYLGEDDIIRREDDYGRVDGESRRLSRSRGPVVNPGRKLARSERGRPAFPAAP
jgi:mannose-6-phosphate isomerase-like protein (cupin superfamily)